MQIKSFILKFSTQIFVFLGLLIIITPCKGEEKMIYPDKFSMDLPELVSPLHRCPATVQFSNEIAHFLNITDQGYGFVNNGDWRCDIGYTLVNMLSRNTLQISNTTMESDTTRKYVVNLLGFEYNSYDPDKLGKGIIKEIIKKSLYENKEFVVARFIEEAFFGGVIIGYEENGDTLLVFSYEPFNFDQNLEPTIAKVSFDKWFESDSKVFYTIGKRISNPKLSDLYMEGLKVAKDCLFEKNGTMKNESDYKKWINILKMTDEGIFTELKKDKQIFGRMEKLTEEEIKKEDFLSIFASIADPQWCDYAERRHYAAHFMRQAKTHFPDVEKELEDTAVTFDEVNPLMYEYIEKTSNPVDLEKLGSLEIRKEMSLIVEKVYEIEKKSMKALENVLNKFYLKDNYLMDKDVRIIYLPPCTVASFHYIGAEPEAHTGEVINKFVKDNKLWEIKPDMKHYGFNHPDPSPEQEFYGYEMWITIPDNMEIPEPLMKKKMEGGLYAAHMIPMGRFEEWGWLFNWANKNEEYEVDWKTSGGENIMGGFLEEALNYINDVQSEKPTSQLDLLLPIKKREK